MTRTQFDAFVTRLISPLKIDTVTIYTPDPWGLDDSYRLLSMHGIQDEAPMFGPAPKELVRLISSPQRVLCIPRLSHSPLFQKSEFMRRERAKSLVRFHLLTDSPYSKERPGAIVFFTYRQAQAFELEYLARLEVTASAVGWSTPLS